MHLDGGDEVSIVPFVYPRSIVNVSSLGYILSVDSSSKPSHPSLPLFLSEHASSKGISIRRGGGGENSLSHRRRRSGIRIG